MRRGPYAFADYLGVTPRSVLCWENGTTKRIRAANQHLLDEALTRAGPDIRARFERILAGPPGKDAGVDDGPTILNTRTASADAGAWEWDGVLRRTVLAAAAAAGLSGGLGLELARHGLNDAVDPHPATDIDDWYEIVREYGDVRTRDTPRREHDRLLTDILSLHATLAHARGARRRELSAVGGLLSLYMAQTVGDLGRQPEARRWWRTAQAAADASGNTHIMCYVRGRKAIRDIYNNRPPQRIIEAVDSAQQLMASAPALGQPSLLAARAQSWALLGDAGRAESDLQALREVFTALPSAVTADPGRHCWAYPEQRVRFAESFVYTHLGDIDAAQDAQRAALALYPPADLYGPIQIELQRALCLVRGGDHRHGAAHALSTLERLPAGYRIREIVRLSEQVLAAVPPAHRGDGQVKDLHELLRSDATPDVLQVAP